MDAPTIDFPEGVYSDVRLETVVTTTITLRDGLMDFPEFVDFIGVQERYDDDTTYRVDPTDD